MTSLTRRYTTPHRALSWLSLRSFRKLTAPIFCPETTAGI